MHNPDTEPTAAEQEQDIVTLEQGPERRIGIYMAHSTENFQAIRVDYIDTRTPFLVLWPKVPKALPVPLKYSPLADQDGEIAGWTPMEKTEGKKWMKKHLEFIQAYIKLVARVERQPKH